ncbi:Ribbon-helix-helix protein, copG family [Orenia metallireducens]|jgi:hypothetical protein|uniref:Ribbon-helix-helix protein, copG family n=1 Tax=Orenia metallireducens TaxID=1413210 RepID=A0A285IHB3_9FIRM|nr:ribbon-helix-helix domain-containing protein [Orenia metallireducens]SNY47375.1 Ribbon-helix-helix protein, copG family [Orenia metallireducens]
MGRFSQKSSKKGALTGLQNKKVNNNDNEDININVNTNDHVNNSNNDDVKPVLVAEKKLSDRKLVGVYLDKKQIKGLDKLVDMTGKSKSEIARKAIDYFIENVEIK